MQIALIQALVELAEMDEHVVYILGDSGCEYDRFYREAFPKRYLDLGIAEQHAVTFASGMAASGWKPFVALPAPFLAYRAFEAVRVDVCMQKRNVKMVGLGSGLSNSALGPTHHGTEDIALMRALPGFVVLSPATAEQAREAVLAAHEIDGPVYLRFGMKAEGELNLSPLKIGDLQQVRTGDDAIVFATGGILFEALAAADLLANQGISVGIINVHTLVPFDARACIRACAGVKHVFTLEEHMIHGGLGSIICEALCGVPVPVVRMGLDNCFAQGYGTCAELRSQNGLDAQSVAHRIWEEMERAQ